MTEMELREFIEHLALNDNGKVCVLVAVDDTGEYRVVKCDNQGRIITVAAS